MSLKVTIKDTKGNLTTLDVHEMHITSNDAKSINVAPATAPPMFQQAQNVGMAVPYDPNSPNGESKQLPLFSQQDAHLFKPPVGSDTAPPTAQQSQPPLSNPTLPELQNIFSQQNNHSLNLLNNGAVNQDVINSYNNKLPDINNMHNQQMQKSNMTQQDKSEFEVNTALSYIDNHAKHFGVSPTLTNHPLFQQAPALTNHPLIQPAPVFQQQPASLTGSKQNGQYNGNGGSSKKRRNKRKKRTRKQRRSRKMSSKR